MKEVLSEVQKRGARVLTVTFDGLSSNFTMCEALGANLDMKDMSKVKPYFSLPGDRHKIYIIADPSHILKLARNTIGNNAVLTDDTGMEIQWKHFVNLENLRAQQDFAHSHKLTKRHIIYKNHKMNVRLAAETLSNSVADSMESLRNKGINDFSDSSPTIRFIRFIDKGFDIMNTTCAQNNNLFKRAIDADNKEEIFSFFTELIAYLSQIKFNTGAFVIRSKSRAAFRGFVVNAINLKAIYEDCIESGALESLQTYRFSQDHLESFFGRIRMGPGCGDNPTVQQFCAAFAKVVICDEIESSESANCLDR